MNYPVLNFSLGKKRKVHDFMSPYSHERVALTRV